MQSPNESSSSTVRLLILTTDTNHIQSRVQEGRHTIEYYETRSNKRLHLSSSYEGWCGALFNELVDHGTALAVVCELGDIKRMSDDVRAMLAVHEIELEVVGGDFDSLREANGDEMFSSRRWGRAQHTDCALKITNSPSSYQQVV